MLIIGLAGRAGSGKTAAAKHLEEKFGFRRVSIAMPIKEAAIQFFGCTHEEVYETKPPHVRTIMQGLGMFVRELKRSFWLERLPFYNERLKKRRLPFNVNWVIDDLRLKDEAQVLKTDYDAILVKIICPDAPVDHMLTDEQKAHPTEAEVDSIEADYIINLPYGNVGRLKEEIEAIASKHIPRPMGVKE
ncbi:MAG: hypothetical protein Q8J64_06455 [Thermodesulfovibrionales bacterium]|nr:hypothetical protein [Thermodesulfovibrionales bacterium]